MERKELAQRAGISYPYLSDIETARGRPSSRTLLAIAGALGLPAHELMWSAEQYERQIASPTRRPTGFQQGIDRPVSDAEPGAAFLAAPPPPGVSSSPRHELDALLDELSPDDLQLVLDLARRLTGRPRP
jgi:transcriptional regulator with XRE-family HTH domain